LITSLIKEKYIFKTLAKKYDEITNKNIYTS